MYLSSQTADHATRQQETVMCSMLFQQYMLITSLMMLTMKADQCDLP